METFIREYQLADTSICDAMLELFRKAVDAKLVRDGLAGKGAAFDQRVKKRTDFSLEQAGALGGVCFARGATGSNALIVDVWRFARSRY